LWEVELGRCVPVGQGGNGGEGGIGDQLVENFGGEVDIYYGKDVEAVSVGVQVSI
jgi:hypothetical protein